MADNTGPLEGTPSQGLQQDTRAPSILRSGSEMASTSENVPFTFTANVLSSFSNLSLGANDQAENPSLRRQSLAPSGYSFYVPIELSDNDLNIQGQFSVHVTSAFQCLTLAFTRTITAAT